MFENRNPVVVMHAIHTHDHSVAEELAAEAAGRHKSYLRATIERLLAEADIRVNGERPWDMRIGDERVFGAIARRGLTGLGDAYMDGWWDCDAIDRLFERGLRADLPRKLRWHPHVVLSCWRDRLVNAQTRTRARRNIRSHYNLDPDVFEATLDPHMAYTCGYWRDAATLDEAQTAKLELICRKLGLRPGMSLLDIGCGWGGFVRYAAERHGVSCVGVTLSDVQADYARKCCEGLDVEIVLGDYRGLDRTFDRITTIGMVEHVGQKNHRAFMAAAHRCLADDGLFLLHTFATRDSFPNRTHSEVDWVERHIFPGLVVPSMKQLGAAFEGRFVTEDVENFGADYDPTLMAWHDNFERSWPELAARYDERFHRMWRYYLLICAAAFRVRAYQVWQFVFSKGGVAGGYRRPDWSPVRDYLPAVV